MVGPEWPCMIITYILIIVPTFFFIYNVAQLWGTFLVVLSTITGTATLICFSFTALSDPGIVFEQSTVDSKDIEAANESLQPFSPSSSSNERFHNDPGEREGEEEQNEKIGVNLHDDIENKRAGKEEFVKRSGGGGPHQQERFLPSPLSSQQKQQQQEESEETERIARGGGERGGVGLREKREREVSSHPWVECSQCEVRRPRNASHCYECGVCIEEIDHHCPWTGKCIGKKNLYPFICFLWALSAHIILVLVVFIIALAQRRDMTPSYA